MSIEVTYRLAREGDLSAMRLIQSTALHDLVVNRGGRAPATIPIIDEPSSEMRHLLRTDPELAWLAIKDGRPIGISMGFVRSELWFLSDLFVLPHAYGRGVGAELLRRCLAAGVERGARIRAVASSHDLGAQTLYIRAGMVPRFPLFGIKGAAGGLSDLPRTRELVKETIRQVEPSKALIRKLGDLDEVIWGWRRYGDHRYWLGEAGLNCIAILDPPGAITAYAYFGASGESRRIGPVAARSARRQLSLLRAIGDALNGQADATVEFRIPGINMTALSALLGGGFRIDHVGQFMASRTFGDFDRYLPSGGTLL